jgi:hypothetical protein
MTKDQIALMAHNYKQRIKALDLAISKLNHALINATDQFTLEIMRAEYSDKLHSLNIDKEYKIAFEGGGWNTTRATNDEDALKFAKAEFDSEHTKVKTVFLSELMPKNF